MKRIFLILIFIGLNLLFSEENPEITQSSSVNNESVQVNEKKGDNISRNRLIITPYLHNHLLIASDAIGYSPELNIFLSLENFLKIPLSAGLSVKYGTLSLTNISINFITFGITGKYNILNLKEINIDLGIIPSINFSYKEFIQANNFKIAGTGVDLTLNGYALYRLIKNLQIGIKAGYNIHFYDGVPFAFFNIGLTVGYDIEL